LSKRLILASTSNQSKAAQRPQARHTNKSA